MGNERVSGLEPDVDVIVVGAGFAGLYMNYALREAGFTVRGFEAAPDVGGTWYWNRYPGCRCDIESMQYSYQFSEELQQAWTWSERYASQPEILSYINHVADRFDLRPHITFETRVDSARFDDSTHHWTVQTSAVDGPDGLRDTTVTARYLVLGVGCLSTIEMPRFVDHDLFAGPIYHTGRWPQHEVDLSNKRVGVIGTGSSAIQSIPIIAEEADHLYVFQRTPNYVVPARNRPLSSDEVATIKADYAEFRRLAKQRFSAFLFEVNPGSTHDMAEDERRAQYEKHWEIGGLPFLGVFGDLLRDQDANQLVIEYWQAKVRAIVDDPTIAARLIPNGDVFGGKRLCAGTGYFETYNRADVTLVDVSGTGIERLTPTGLVAKGTEFDLDVIVCATGFDAMTGSVVRMDITGPEGMSVAEKWRYGPDNYLGIMINGFPNLFNMQGPGSPSVFATMVTGMEHQGDWITGCLGFMREQGHTRVEATVDAERGWMAEVAKVAEPSLRSKCDSWYIGSNIEGKPRVFMPYIGGFPAYVDACQQVANNGYPDCEFG